MNVVARYHDFVVLPRLLAPRCLSYIPVWSPWVDKKDTAPRTQTSGLATSSSDDLTMQGHFQGYPAINSIYTSCVNLEELKVLETLENI